jgi:NADPH:quinone reductase-like Zn-dependent oxidoreductase
MAENKALWLNAKRAPLTVGPAPYTPARADEIVVRVRAVAVNPMDRLQPTMGDIFKPWTTYPFVVGSDVAGDVVEVGSGVTRLQVGDRVVGYAAGADKQRNRAAEGAFQDYVVLLAHMAAPIPDTMTFEDATVLPLGISTASCGLFQRDFLAMNAPSAAPRPTGKTLLVWGGSTSVGSNAIQLAVAAGYDVVTTASPRSFAYVKRLGAREAFDYRSKTVISDVVSALRGRRRVGDRRRFGSFVHRHRRRLQR